MNLEKCHICEKMFKPSSRLEARDGYYYLKCPYCTGGKLMPRKKALSKLSSAYQSTYFDWKDAGGFRKYLNKLTLFTPYPEWIENIAKRKGRLLDVGAGVPGFVLNMKNNGWDVYALEIAKQQVKLIRKFIGEKQVWQGDFEKYRIKKGSLNVLTFWHMLEHLIEPAEAIRKSSSILVKKGILFAEFPNFDSFNLKIFKSDYCYFDLPGHLVYYNKKSLRTVFEKNGFKILEITYPLKLNGSFSLNLANRVFKQTKSRTLQMLTFYLTLPLSLVLSVFFAFTGKTDLMRIAAIKK